LLEEDIVRRAKTPRRRRKTVLQRSHPGRLERYLSEGVAEPARREAAYNMFCERPMRLAPDQLKAVLEHDSWDL